MGIFDKAIDRLAVAITKASPIATPIEGWQMNQQNQYGNTVGLPREANMGNVPFAPGVPILPGAINPVRADGRPDPRRYEFQVAQNINITETRLVPFKTLRAAADQIDILRRCVEVIKQKMVGLDWDIVLGDDAIEKVMAETGEKSNIRAMQIAKEKYSDEINRMRQFWEQPDVSNGLVFADWLNMALEEILVIDAWAVWPQSTVGGDILGLQILDGSTIKPLIDDRGMRPTAGTAAYQQILFGFPRSEFSAPTETEEADGEFLADELQYMVRNRRTNTVYGYSPVERALSVADIYLRRQQWLRAEYTDGVMPELLFESSADFGNNPDLLKAYENVFNDDLAGQTAERKRARILPTGLKAVQYEGYGEKFKDVLDEYLVNSICGHFGVLPTEIGFAPKGGLGGSGFQDGQAESSEVIGVMPLANWTARMLTNLSYVFLGMPRELEFKFQPSGRNDAAGMAAEIDIKRKNGGLTLNEARSREGLPLIEAPEADQPMIVTPAGVFFVTDDGLVPIADPASEPAPEENPDATGEVPTESETPEESDAENGAPQSDDEAKKALGAWSASNQASGISTKYDRDQPRKPNGQFGSSIGSLASQAEGGFSVRAVDFKEPTRGYMVARPEGGVVIDAPDLESTKQGLKDFMAQNKERFASDPTLYIGGWKDSNTGKLYLELSDNVASKRIASELGTRRDQVAVWDVVGKREIGTGGTGGERAEPGTSANPDELYGSGTVIRKGTFGLLRVVSGGTGFGSGSVSERDSGQLDKYSSQQTRDDHGRWVAIGHLSGMTPEVADYIRANPRLAKFGGEFKTAEEAKAFLQNQPNEYGKEIPENERKALASYVGNGYEPNQIMRGQKVDTKNVQGEVIDPLTHAVNNSSFGQDVFVSRGMRDVLDPTRTYTDSNGYQQYKKAYGSMEVGTVFSDPAFTSTSADPKTAEIFASHQNDYHAEDGVIMHVRVPAGTPALSANYNNYSRPSNHEGGFGATYEYEVVLKPSQQFRVVGKVQTTATELMGNVGDYEPSSQIVTHLFVEAING